MPAHEWIKVIFRKLHFKRNAISSTSIADLYFVATVNGQPVGDKTQINHIAPNGVIELSAFEALVDVAPLGWVDISFQVMDQRNFVSDDDLGSLTYKLQMPYAQSERTDGNSMWRLEWAVELMANGKFGQHSAGAIFTARSGTGFVNVNTVAGREFNARIEINPVRPVPPDAKLPPRPAFPAGTPAAKLNKGGIPVINPTDDINIIPNPAVIPILTAAEATESTAAIIEYTYYRPYLLNFTTYDDRLTWSQTSISGGATVKFIGGAPGKGLRVFAYGVKAGEVLLEVKLEKVVIASYRALVGPIKKAFCRFNILNGQDMPSTPRSKPENVRDHLAIANRFLRQMAIELSLDTNVTPRPGDGAELSNIPGIFRIRVDDAVTRNVSLTGFPACVALNFRSGVMNFAYIFSTALQDPTKPNERILGAASDWPANPAGTTVTDSGTPSSSLKIPSGIEPDAAAAAVTMNIFAARQRARPTGVAGMYVCDSNGDPAEINAQQTYAGTIAHEFGHNLTLRHRNLADVGGQDGVRHPPDQNVMHWNNPTSLAQDFDILQAIAARQSPLVT